jgi:hypothetical protein
MPRKAMVITMGTAVIKPATITKIIMKTITAEAITRMMIPAIDL